MKRIGIALLYALIGYGVGAILGYFFILQFSSNLYDRGLEAAMTAAFAAGPLGAVIAFIVGFVRG